MKNKKSNFIAFDLGSSKIAGISAFIDNQGNAKINSQILQQSQGFKSGVITNMKKAEMTLINAIYSLEKECDKSIKEITISIPGAGIKSYYLNNKIKIGNNAISKQDVKKLISKALSEFKIKNREIIQYYPIQFLDGNKNSVENPIGIYTNELSVQLHIITADSFMLMNLTKCFAKCHVEVKNINASIYYSSLSCLNQEEKSLGSVIVDIGSKTTSFAIMYENNIIYVDYLPIGSDDITINIAKAFSISKTLAEKLKIIHGNANPLLIDQEKILIDQEKIAKVDNSPNIDLASPMPVITNIALSKIINEQIISIFKKIQFNLDEIGMNDMIAKRMVITGGGAAIDGLRNIATEFFDKQIRISRPEHIDGFSDNFNPYMYAPILGMVRDQMLLYNRDGLQNVMNENSGLLKKTFQWLKENI